MFMTVSHASIASAYLHPCPEPILFTDAQWIQAMLRFEAQLALAQAECGLIPELAAQAITTACAAIALDPIQLTTSARHTGALGMAVVAPLQQWLQQHKPDALPWLHWGTTTQDVVDTANALLTADALQHLQHELKGLQQQLCQLARQHANTPILGRSLLQPAQVTSFGLKCAQAAAALARSRRQLSHQAQLAICVQLGGAVGNAASYGSEAQNLERTLARRLGIHANGYSWHTQRDAWMRLGMEVAVCGGSLAKLAQDWALQSQYEVGELSEAPRGRTSSAMPHKRNPVHCLQALTHTQAVPQLAATLLSCMPQAHERALGEWQAEVVHWMQLWTHVHAAAAALHAASQGLQVNAARMQAHIDSLFGVVYSEAYVQLLSQWLDKPKAQTLVAQCSEQSLQNRSPLDQTLQAALTAQGLALKPQALAQLHAVTQSPQAVKASALRCQEVLAELGNDEPFKEREQTS